jgi:hypothetical protein
LRRAGEELGDGQGFCGGDANLTKGLEVLVLGCFRSDVFDRFRVTGPFGGIFWQVFVIIIFPGTVVLLRGVRT